jgi:hypothetical protein
MGQLGGRKPARQIRRRHIRRGDPIANHIGVGNLLRRTPDLDLDVVIAEQEVELLGQIVRRTGPAASRSGHRGRGGETAISGTGERLGGIAVIADAQLRISERAGLARVRIGRLAVSIYRVSAALRLSTDSEKLATSCWT